MEAKAAVNEASALNAALAKSPIPARLVRPWPQKRQLAPMTLRAVHLKTANAANADRVTATAVTAANVLSKHVQTLQPTKPLVMTPPNQAA